MDGKIVYITGDKYEDEVLKSNLPVCVYFYSDDCPVCSVLGPIYERFAQIYGTQMKFVKIQRMQNRQLSEKLNVKNSPTLLFYKDGGEVCSRLTGYITNVELKQSVEGVIGGQCPRRERGKVYCDVLILGGGPGGLSAAIYTTRAKLFTIVLDSGMVGGQVATTYHVANYPGTNGVVRGIDLMENMKKQALDFGAQIDDLKEIRDVLLDGEQKCVITDDTDYYSKALIIATGATPRKLPAEGEKEFRGRGIHYCATCDGALYQDANVIVVGGGNSATEEAEFLTRYAKHVTVVHQFDHFQASKAAQDQVFNNPNISVIWDSEIRSVKGEKFVKSIEIENIKTKERKEIEAEGVFVYIGMQPKTEFLKDKLTLNEYGYIPTDEDMKTSVPGVFAVGDVRVKKVRQIATATGDGVVASISVEKYINNKE